MPPSRARLDRMQSVGELGDRAEVAAAPAPERPEQPFVARRRSPRPLAGHGRLRRGQRGGCRAVSPHVRAIGPKPPPCASPATPTAAQPPPGDGEAARVGGEVHLPPGGARADVDDAALGVDADLLHGALVDHQRVRRSSSTLRRRGRPTGTSPARRAAAKRTQATTSASDTQRAMADRAPVDTLVERPTEKVVGRVSGKDEVALQLRPEQSPIDGIVGSSPS